MSVKGAWHMKSIYSWPLFLFLLLAPPLPVPAPWFVLDLSSSLVLEGQLTGVRFLLRVYHLVLSATDTGAPSTRPGSVVG